MRPATNTATLRLRALGEAELPAYGIADAEHQLEKELRAAWPEARVEVLEVRRAADPAREAAPRIVEEFRLRYRVTGAIAVAAPGEEARRAALRTARARFAGTRFARMEWEMLPG